MSKIAVFFGEGYEEIEALTVVDICRRAGIDVSMVSITDNRQVCGSHGICVTMDMLLTEVDFEKYDMLVLPGGMPGTRNLEACVLLMEKLDRFFEKEKYIAAICAAPSIFGHRGYVKGRNACCYPGFESQMEGADVTVNEVEIAGKVITSRGMGTAIPFALAIVGKLVGEQAAEELEKGIVYRQRGKENG